jgi:hypothetical protein
MPVGHEVKAVVLFLKLDPVFKGSVEIAEMKAPRGTHAAQDSLSISHSCVFLLIAQGMPKHPEAFADGASSVS